MFDSNAMAELAALSRDRYQRTMMQFDLVDRALITVIALLMGAPVAVVLRMLGV